MAPPDGVNEHVGDMRRARGHKTLMKFVATRRKEKQSAACRRLSATTTPADGFLTWCSARQSSSASMAYSVR